MASPAWRDSSQGIPRVEGLRGQKPLVSWTIFSSPVFFLFGGEDDRFHGSRILSELALVAAGFCIAFLPTARYNASEESAELGVLQRTELRPAPVSWASPPIDCHGEEGKPGKAMGYPLLPVALTESLT